MASGQPKEADEPFEYSTHTFLGGPVQLAGFWAQTDFF